MLEGIWCLSGYLRLRCDCDLNLMYDLQCGQPVNMTLDGNERLVVSRSLFFRLIVIAVKS